MAELYLGRPLFPGSNAQDQLLKIVSILGTPPQSTGMNVPQMTATPLQSLMRSLSNEGNDLLMQMLKFDPKQRVSAA
jgi:serine/threonine protein kinase